ncbi:MAG: RDD family protein [Bacillota bacterium]|nr:RDD family protein [Bacillota bacterium]
MNIENLLIMSGERTLDLRILAAIIDSFIITLLTILFCITNNLKGEFNLTIIYCIITIIYFVILESISGYTIGKFIFRIKVINENCRKPKIVQALIRSLFWLIEVNPFLFVIPVITYFITKKSRYMQRFGDKFAKTYIVRSKYLKEFISDENMQNSLTKDFVNEFYKPKANIKIKNGVISSKYIEVIYDGHKTKKVEGLKGMTIDEVLEGVNNGGRFAIFKYCVSLVTITSKQPSNIIYIKPNDNLFKYHWTYTLTTIIIGWWSILGIPWSIECLNTNFNGGIDATDLVVTSLINKKFEN